MSGQEVERSRGKEVKRLRGKNLFAFLPFCLLTFLPFNLFAFCMVIGCGTESSISKLKEQLEAEKKKREEESKKYVEVLNRLDEEMKRSEEKEKLIADLRLAQKTGESAFGGHELEKRVRSQESRVESQNSSPSSQREDRGEVGLKTQDSGLGTQIDKLIQLANRFYLEGDYATAKEIYEVAIELGSSDVDTLFRLAKCCGVTPETDKAISFYQKVIAFLEHNDASNPLYHQAYNNLGGMYKKKGMYKEAELAYVKAVEINKEYTNAYYNLGLLYEENLDDELGAIACYERYIELDGERSAYVKKQLDEIKARD